MPASGRRGPTCCSEYLRPLGYRNYHSGKWHLDSSPLKCGFDRSYALSDYDHNFSPKHHTLDDQPLPPVEARRRLLLGRRDRRSRDRLLEGASARSTPTSRSSPMSRSPFRTSRCKRRRKTSRATKTDTTSAGTQIRHDRWQRIEQMLHLPGELSALEPNDRPALSFEQARQEAGPRRSLERNAVERPVRREAGISKPARWQSTRRWSTAWIARSAACSTSSTP